MDVNDIYKAKAKAFLKEYRLHDISLQGITDIIQSQGYKIIQYNTFDYNESVESLLSTLGLKQYSISNVAFSYRDGDIKIVFIDDSLLDKDKLYALVHEEGHIFCGHMDHNMSSSVSVEEEKEANEFTHYVINPPITHKLSYFIKTNRIAVTLIACLTVITILWTSTGMLAKSFPLNAFFNGTKTLDYYVTEHGEKYHKKNCRIIKDKDNIRRITEDEMNSNKYEPCMICKP